MEMKPGYKQTEVGVVPEDWEVEELQSIANVTSGKRIPLGESLTKSNTGFPYIRVSDLKPGGVDLDNIHYVPEHVAPRIHGYRIFKDELFISVAGTLGIVGQIPEELNGANLTENADRISGIKCNASYLMYQLLSARVESVINSIRTVGAQPKLALERIRKFQICLPPLHEQAAIANALSDVDALIESVEKLIEKKKAIKQGAMQELLTGKRRLPGFGDGKGYRQTELGLVPEDWEVASLMQLSESLQNGLFLEPARRGNGIPIVNVSDLYGRSPIDIQILELFGASHSEVSRFACKKGDLFFTRSSLVPSGIAKCNYLDRVDDEIVFDSHVVRMRPRQDLVSYSYLFSALSGRACRSFLISNSKTGTLTTIDQAVLRKCPVLLAPLPEQTAIANVLSDMDSEIEALESKLTKTKQLKQGMMSELLTGRIRLV
jgi:type I restriction enzyme S subunit